MISHGRYNSFNIITVCVVKAECISAFFVFVVLSTFPLSGFVKALSSYEVKFTLGITIGRFCSRCSTRRVDRVNTNSINILIRKVAFVEKERACSYLSTLLTFIFNSSFYRVTKRFQLLNSGAGAGKFKIYDFVF